MFAKFYFMNATSSKVLKRLQSDFDLVRGGTDEDRPIWQLLEDRFRN